MTSVTTPVVVHSNVSTASLLSDLASASEDAVRLSVYMPVDEPGTASKKDLLRWKNTLRRAENMLENEYGFAPRERDAFLAPLHAFAEDRLEWGRLQDGLAAFCSDQYCFLATFPIEFSPYVYMGSHFYCLPLLPHLHRQKQFAILALSQHSVRLLLADDTTVHSTTIDTVYDRIRHTVRLEKQEPSVHHRKTGSDTQVYGHGAYPDSAHDDAHELLTIVDKEVCSLLAKETPPLVVVAAEPTRSLYMRLSGYPHIHESSIEGSPDGWSTEEIHQRALRIMEPYFAHEASSILECFTERSHPVSTDVDAILPAAYHGRIDTLLLRDGAKLPGIFHPATGTVEVHAQLQQDDEDLLNTACIHTLRSGGRVLSFPGEQMPSESSIAALLRY